MIGATAAFGRYGVAVIVESDDERDLDGLAALLPRDWRRTDPAVPTSWRVRHITIWPSDEDRHVRCDGVTMFVGDLDTALDVVRSEIQTFCAGFAKDRTFIHAAALEIDGHALLLPGPSRQGKSTLTQALVQAGAGYLSDDIAILDSEGLVRAFGRPIRLRSDRGWVSASTPPVSTRRLRPRWIVDVRFEPGVSGLSLSPMTLGQASMALLANAHAARISPQQTLEHSAAVSRMCRAWRGVRGDADEAAAALLAMLRAT